MSRNGTIQSINHQTGFTLVEVIMVLGVLLILAVVITMSIAQVFTLNSNSTAHMTAVKEVEDAVHYLTRDAQMAQQVTVSVPPGFPLTLSWTEWNSDHIEVNYRIDNNRLIRSRTVNGHPPEETVIIAHIDTGTSSCSITNRQITLHIVSGITGFKKQTEARTFTIVRRAG
jgi:prepilin-type N-terminal cleavage/methylation domain-containing protein